MFFKTNIFCFNDGSVRQCFFAVSVIDFSVFISYFFTILKVLLTLESFHMYVSWRVVPLKGSFTLVILFFALSDLTICELIHAETMLLIIHIFLLFYATISIRGSALSNALTFEGTTFFNHSIWVFCSILSDHVFHIF